MNWVGKKKKLNLLPSIGLLCGMGSSEGNETTPTPAPPTAILPHYLWITLNLLLTFLWVVRELLSDQACWWCETTATWELAEWSGCCCSVLFPPLCRRKCLYFFLFQCGDILSNTFPNDRLPCTSSTFCSPNTYAHYEEFVTAEAQSSNLGPESETYRENSG